MTTVDGSRRPGVIDTTDLERLYRRIITLETAGRGMLAGHYGGSNTASLAYTLMCQVLDHPENEYKPGHCYCTARKS